MGFQSLHTSAFLSVVLLHFPWPIYNTEANTLANAGGGGGSPIRERTNSDGAIDKVNNNNYTLSLFVRCLCGQR